VTKNRVKGGAPNEYYVTYDSIQCIGRGKEVILNLKDSSVVRGKYWGIWGIEEKPMPVYVVLPEHRPQVVDTLRDWVPAAGERIIVYSYPSNSIVFEGVADDEMWYGMVKSTKQKLYYMTPKLVVKPIVTAEISQGSTTVNVPVDSISQVVRRQTVKPDPPGGHLVVGIVFVAGAVALAYGIALLAWASAGGKIM
jgi:hypothetical protein